MPPKVTKAQQTQRWLGNFANTLVVSSATDLMTTFLGPGKRAIEYEANARGSNLIPDMGACVQLYVTGRLNDAEFRWLTERHGAAVNFNEVDSIAMDVWRRVVAMAYPVFTPEEVVYYYRQGQMTNAVARDYLAKNGWWRASDQTNILNVTEQLDIQSILDAHRQGLIDEGSQDRLLKAAGLMHPDYRWIAQNLSTGVSPADAQALYLRCEISQIQRGRYFARTGIMSTEDERDILKALQGVPSPSDLTLFAVREVWNREVVERFGYDEEFDLIPEYRWWMRAQGYSGNPNPTNCPQNPYTAPLYYHEGQDVPRPPDALMGRDGWARAYWRAHWQLPSPTQGYEFFHRLRPDRIERYQEFIPGVRSFEIGDLRTLLKVADYPGPFRDRLAAISYRTITRVDLRRLYDAGVFDQAEVYEQYLDRGYNPEDARAMTQWTVRDRRQRRLRKVKDRELKRQERFFRQGLTTQLQYTMALIDGGTDPEEAQAWAASVALDIDEQVTLEAMAATRKGYVTWQLDRVEATGRLARIGMPSANIDRTLDLWDLERETRGRRVAAGQLSRWVVRGVMKPGAAVDRLEEMGYDRSDALRIIRVAMQDRDILDARSRRAMAQTDKERQRALAAEIRASERQTAQARRQLASTGTPARLAQWLKKGLITRMEAYRRLVRMGWTEVDANRHLDAAEPLPPRVRPEPIMDPNAPAERQR